MTCAGMLRPCTQMRAAALQTCKGVAFRDPLHKAFHPCVPRQGECFPLTLHRQNRTPQPVRQRISVSPDFAATSARRSHKNSRRHFRNRHTVWHCGSINGFLLLDKFQAVMLCLFLKTVGKSTIRYRYYHTSYALSSSHLIINPYFSYLIQIPCSYYSPDN